MKNNFPYNSNTTNMNISFPKNNEKNYNFIYNELDFENIPEGKIHSTLIYDKTNSYQLINKKDYNIMLIEITNILDININFKLLKKNSTDVVINKPIISYIKLNDKLIYKIIGLLNYVSVILYIFKKHSNSSLKYNLNKKNDAINIKFKLYQEEDYEINNFPFNNIFTQNNNYSIYLLNDTNSYYNSSFILREIYFKRNKNNLKKKKFLLKLRKNEEQKRGNKNDDNTTEEESSDDDKTGKKKSKWWIILIILTIILIIIFIILFIFRKHIFKRKINQPEIINTVKVSEKTPYEGEVRIEFKEK